MQRVVYDMTTGESIVVETSPEESPFFGEVTQEVPYSVTRLQAKAALMQAGLLATVETLVAQSSPMIQLAWAEASEFQRQSETIKTLASSLNWTEGQLDDLFVQAATITF